VSEVKGVKVSELDLKLEEFKEEVFAEVRSRFNLEGLKDEPVFRAYRDFFWRIGVDPTVKQGNVNRNNLATSWRAVILQ